MVRVKVSSLNPSCCPWIGVLATLPSAVAFWLKVEFQGLPEDATYRYNLLLVLQWFILLPRVLAFVSWDWYWQTRFYRRWFIIPLRCILLGAVLHSGACQGRVWHHPTTRRRWRRRAELVLQPHGEFSHHAAAKFEGRGGHFVGARRCQRVAPQYLHAVTVFLAPSSGSSTPSSGDEKETTARRRVKGKGSRCSH